MCVGGGGGSAGPRVYVFVNVNTCVCVRACVRAGVCLPQCANMGLYAFYCGPQNVCMRVRCSSIELLKCSTLFHEALAFIFS